VEGEGEQQLWAVLLWIVSLPQTSRSKVHFVNHFATSHYRIFLFSLLALAKTMPIQPLKATIYRGF